MKSLSSKQQPTKKTTRKPPKKLTKTQSFSDSEESYSRYKSITQDTDFFGAVAASPGNANADEDIAQLITMYEAQVKKKLAKKNNLVPQYKKKLADQVDALRDTIQKTGLSLQSQFKEASDKATSRQQSSAKYKTFIKNYQIYLQNSASSFEKIAKNAKAVEGELDTFNDQVARILEMNRDYVSQAFKGVEELIADGKAKVYSLNGESADEQKIRKLAHMVNNI